jgi:hypothetical protein
VNYNIRHGFGLKAASEKPGWILFLMTTQAGSLQCATFEANHAKDLAMNPIATPEGLSYNPPAFSAVTLHSGRAISML